MNILTEKREIMISVRIPRALHEFLVQESNLRKKECKAFSSISDLVVIALRDFRENIEK